MASQTLIEAKKFINNEIVSGIVEDIITINPFNAVLPYDGYEGQAILVNRENILGDSQIHTTIDATITAKAAASFVQASYSANRIVGDVEMDNLLAVQSRGAGVDQMAIEISSKAKSIARTFQGGMVGEGTAGINSFHSEVDASQWTTALGNGNTGAGQTLSFALLDELLDLVVAKDGQVDFIQMAPRTMRSYKVLLRTLGGTAMDDVITLPDGRTMIGYESVPIFKNGHIPITEDEDATTTITGGTFTSVWAGCVDDGTRRVGVAAIHPIQAPAGIQVKNIGEMETKDNALFRVVQYVNFVNYNRRGLARLNGISN